MAPASLRALQVFRQKSASLLFVPTSQSAARGRQSVRYSNHIWRLIVEEEDLFDDVITNHILLRDEASLIFVH